MRLFLDQMIDRSVADVLRKRGYDVECAAEVGMARADDLEILEYCAMQDRVLITLDEHFGNWTVTKLTEHSGVIRLKVNPTSARSIEKTLIPFLEHHSRRDFRSILAIVKPAGIRWIHTA